MARLCMWALIGFFGVLIAVGAIVAWWFVPQDVGGRTGSILLLAGLGIAQAALGFYESDRVCKWQGRAIEQEQNWPDQYRQVPRRKR